MREIQLYDRKMNEKELISYGFQKDGDDLSMMIRLRSFPFLAFYTFRGNVLKCCLLDEATREEYELVDVFNRGYGYSRLVNVEYEEITKGILEKCTDKVPSQAQRIIDHTTKRYGDALERLWIKFPDDAIIRKKENGKWYCLFMKVEGKKLGLSDKRTYEVIDLRGDEEDIRSIDNKIYFPGYHMEKKHWFALILDERVSDETIFSLIEKSRLRAK